MNLIQVTDANGNATLYAHTARGEVAQETLADGAQVTYAYDPRGQVSTTTLEDGATITATYDAAGRRTHLDFSTGGSQSLVYDEGGRLTRAAQTLDGHTTTTGYGYDTLGSIVTTTQQLDSGTVWEVRYGYDPIHGTSVVTYPSGMVVTHTLDTLGRLDTVQRDDGTTVADYSHDILNHVNSVAYPNGLTNYVDFDALGRTTRVRVNDGSSDVVDYRYGYDNVGNRTYMQRMHQPGQPAEVYEYDSLYQLINVWYGADATTPAAITGYAATQAYDLDLMGNRLEVTGDATTDTYGPNDGTQSTDPRHQYTNVNGETLSYDLRGNTLFDGANTYAYDVLNRQTRITNTQGSAQYFYDARGRRLAKTLDTITTTHYIYDTQYRVLEERAGDGSLLARYTYGAGIDEPLTLERDGQTYYYHRDALGSISEVSDGSGSIVERYEYDVYGAVAIFDGSDNTLVASAIGNPYLFTGRRYDPESGNYYYRARIYSPGLGRFLSVDPLGFDAGDYNLYRYAFNNPTNLTDPTGEFASVLLALLGKATLEAGVNILAQASFNYIFDPSVDTIGKAIASVDQGRVAMAFVTGLLPGGRLVRSAAEAWYDVFLYLLDADAECRDVSPEGVLTRFLLSLGREYVLDYVADKVVELGFDAVRSGLKRLGWWDEAAEAAIKGACSFSEDTLVMTDEGYLVISDVAIGDYVLAYNEATGEVGYYPVTALWAHEDAIIVHLLIDGETIETTPEHPFYTDKGAWIPAGDLQPGDHVRRADGSYGSVESAAFELKSQAMYNVTVLGAHTYFVGEGQWLVHNGCALYRIKDFFNKLVTTPGRFDMKTVDTKYGQFDVGGMANINGTQIHIAKVIIEPVQEETRDIGERGVMELIIELGKSAKEQGFRSLRITGIRITGANPGHLWDETFDLARPMFK